MKHCDLSVLCTCLQLFHLHFIFTYDCIIVSFLSEQTCTLMVLTFLVISGNGNDTVGKMEIGTMPDYGNGMGLEWEKSDGMGENWNKSISRTPLLFTSLPAGQRNGVVSTSLGVFVCVSAISGTITYPNMHHHIFCACCPWPLLGPPLAALCNVLPVVCMTSFP